MRRNNPREPRLLFWHKILLLLAGSIFVLSLGFWFLTFLSMRQAGREIEIRGKEVLSRQTEAFLANLVQGQVASLDLQLAQAQLAATYGAVLLGNALQHHPFDWDSIHSIFSPLLDRTASAVAIYYVTLSGTLVMYPAVEKDVTFPLDYQLIREPFFPSFAMFRDRVGEARWSEVHRSPFSAGYDSVADIISPVLVNGLRVGYVGVSVSIVHLMARLGQHQPVGGSYLFLMDARRQFIGGSPLARVDLMSASDNVTPGTVCLGKTDNPVLEGALQRMALGQTSLEKLSIKNELRYFVSHPLAATDWRLGLVVPVSMVTAASRELVEVIGSTGRRTLFWVLSWVMALLVAALVVGAVLTRRLTSPIRQMAAAARGISGGDLGCRVDATGGEMGYLAEAFNTMSDRVREMVSSLERKNAELEELIRERERVESELRKTEDKYRSIYENAVEGIFQSTPEGRNLAVNPALARIMGYDSVEEYLVSVVDLRNQQYVDPTRRDEFVKKIHEHGSVSDFDLQARRKDGSIIWTRMNARLVQDKAQGTTYYEGFLTDITARRRAEEELKRVNERLMKEQEERKFLSRKLIDLLEIDRKSIAMELHDHIGQIVTTLKMDLELIASQLKKRGDAAMIGRIGAAQDKAVQVVRSIREIAHGLRPSVLDDFGLVSSIESLINDIMGSAQIQVRFFHRNVPGRLGHERDTMVYRVVQEALCNIIKHSGARNAFVNLIGRGDILSLSIEDDGLGFQMHEVSAERDDKPPLGLLIMRERITLIDGELSIESHPGRGTHLIAEIPVQGGRVL